MLCLLAVVRGDDDQRDVPRRRADLREGDVDLAVDWLPIDWEPYVNRKLFEEQLQLMLKCFDEESFHHKGKYYEAPPAVEHYGPPSKVGFKDVIHRWKAEHWDPQELVALYKRAGAQYFFDKTGEFDLACNTIKRIAHERSARGLNYTGAHHV